MKAEPLQLATLDEAAPFVRKLREALAGVQHESPADPDAERVLARLRTASQGWLLCDLVAEVELGTQEVEAALRRLSRQRLAQQAAGSDGVVRWWAR